MNFLTKAKYNGLKKKVVKAHAQREQQASNQTIDNEIKAQFELAKFYDANRFDKDLANAEIFAFECYRLAAELGSAAAQHICGQRLIEKGRFWESLNSTIYKAKAHARYAQACYEEGFAFLTAAEKQDYPLARRLHGMALINGWGLEKDMDSGFKLVIESIDLEGSWNRATQIFGELGLNSPEFFEALRAHKTS